MTKALDPSQPVFVSEKGLPRAEPAQTPQGVEGVLVPQSAVHARTEEMATLLTKKIPTNTIPVALIVLKGAAFFAAKLLHALRKQGIFLEPRFCKAESYRSGQTAGKLEFLAPDIQNRHVLLIEDVLDTGQTLTALVNALRARGNTVTTVVLAHKRAGKTIFEPDLVGFSLPDKFLAGCGMDFDQKYRALPFIGFVQKA